MTSRVAADRNVHATITSPRPGRRPGCPLHHAPTRHAGFCDAGAWAPCCEWPVTRSRRAARSGWPRPAGRWSRSCRSRGWTAVPGTPGACPPESLRGTLVASVYRAGRPRRTGHGTGQRAGEAAYSSQRGRGSHPPISAMRISWMAASSSPIAAPGQAAPASPIRLRQEPGSQPAEQQAPGQAVGDAGPANPARPPAGSRLASAHPAGGAAVDTARFRGRRSASGGRPNHAVREQLSERSTRCPQIIGARERSSGQWMGSW